MAHKTTLEREHMILTTLYLVGAKNTDKFKFKLIEIGVWGHLKNFAWIT
jgi:hypothetical protein